MFYWVIKPRGKAEWFYNPIKHNPQRSKIQSLDTNIVNMMAESLNFWLTKFEEVCKEDGDRYPHWNAEFTVCGSVLYICDFL